MSQLSVRATLNKDEHTTVVNIPCNDYGIDIALQNIGETDMTETTQYCTHIGGDIRELAVLENQLIDIDELNFLGKYLDSFTDDQVNQFRAAMLVTNPTKMKDIINLAFNLHNYTLITDFSDIAAVGKTHRLNVEMAIPTDDSYDYATLGESLLSSGKGVATPYGVLFVNDLPMNEVYNGQTFPQYLYEECTFGATIESDGAEEYLYLPCTHSAVDRALRRLGADDLSECHLTRLDGGRYNTDFLNKIVPDYDATDIPELNDLAAVLTEMSPDDIPKLIAVCDYADVETFAGAERIADNLDSFEYAPNVDGDTALGEYLIKDSGYYDYNSDLEDYFDFEAFGCDTCTTQGGQFTEYGYVGIKDDISLDDILGKDENDMTMGGM